MDVYHQVLNKLYKDTGGKVGNSVDFVDLLGKLNLKGNYEDIVKHLSDQGWIAESTKPRFVGITPWGVAEARKSQASGASNAAALQQTKFLANRSAALAQELSELLTQYAQNVDDFGQASAKFAELKETISQIK